ncbi:MAG: flavin reductase family protein [Oscillospiraceae bacterium]|jgi:flavin reductase (DIM6/NTAB) family NADH-FMN oxidoreductase RutF|nr:flavin reductase family protein [Oscillospiraceae bacterium]
MDSTALFTLSHGVYIAGTQTGGRVLDAVSQVEDGTAPILAVSFMARGETVRAVREHGRFTLSVLGQDADPWILANFGFQSSAKADKWGAFPHEEWLGFPVLQDSLARVLLEVEEERVYPNHVLTLCRVVDAEKVRAGEPMTYGYYQSDVKRAAQAAFRAHLN